jgi:hypothetical protein
MGTMRFLTGLEMIYIKCLGDQQRVRIIALQRIRTQSVISRGRRTVKGKARAMSGLPKADGSLASPPASRQLERVGRLRRGTSRICPAFASMRAAPITAITAR